MKLAPDSHQRLELFFREYLEDGNFKLPQIYFYAGNFTGFFTKIIQVQGITFGRRIFILPALVQTNLEDKRTLSQKLVAHEISHVIQYKREGFIKFFYKYLINYWKNLKRKKKWDVISRHTAYLEIPFEIEAREIAEKFVEWCENDKRLS